MISALSVGAAVAGCAASEPPHIATAESGLTSSFQTGIGGYTGTIDGQITDRGGGNGTKDFSSTNARITKHTKPAYESEALVRFTNLSLPPGAVVTSATLTLTFRDSAAGHILRGYYLRSTWNAAFVGWLTRDSGLNWNTPGAKGLGTDISSTQAFVDTSWAGTGIVTKTYPLDAAIVQGWIDDPSTNLGVILFNNEVANRMLRVLTSETETIAYRPMLTIGYTVDTQAPDTQAPSVTMTSPPNGATYGWNTDITVAAMATDDVGVAGVQFLVDGEPFGAEDTTSPYAVTYNTGAVNAAHTFTARAHDAAGNTATAVAVTVTVQDPGAPASHPRIWMDAAGLQALRQKAAAGDARWTALESKCNSYLGGTVRAPDPVKCLDSCSGSTICCGYQGESYYPALLNVALCYQIGRGLEPPHANTTAWAQKGADVLAQMIAFTNYTADHGYGIRFFATGMAIGYDWLHDYLTANDPALKTNVVTRLNEWIDWYDAQPSSYNFREHPTSNYFAGYYAAKALTALATEGDNTSASTYWTAFLGLQRDAVGTHAGIAPYYTRFLDGGGWVQGWQYGPLAVRNMIEPSLAAWTSKGVDLVTDSNAPYRYAVNNALHLIHFSTPSLTMMDDRDELSSFNPADPGQCPSKAKVPVSTALTLTEMLRRWPVQLPSGDALAPTFQSFVRAVRTIYTPEPWQDMLFWDDSATETAYTSMPERSYLATNYVSMRSDWSTSATMATMRAIAYSDKDNTHEHPDGGSLSITRGSGGAVGDWRTDVPFLVTPNFLMRCYGTTSILSTWQSDLRTDLLTTSGARSTINGFRNSTSSGQSIGIYQDASPAPQSQISTFEDRNAFVFARAENLDDLYPSTSGISEWSRDVVYVRPSLFVVYDRTTSSGSGADPHMSWHFAPIPILVAPPSSGAVRYDVADGAVFKGAMTTLLPANASVSTPENVFSSNKLYGIQVRGPSSGSIKWLTVFDAATSSAAVATASRIQTMNANGALLTSTGGSNKVVLFGLGAAGNPITGAISYTQPASQTAVIVTDLQPNTTYAVTVTLNGPDHDVSIAQGVSSFTTSARGTLYLHIAANGTVTAGM